MEIVEDTVCSTCIKTIMYSYREVAEKARAEKDRTREREYRADKGREPRRQRRIAEQTKGESRA
jgi:hypothetical protein